MVDTCFIYASFFPELRGSQEAGFQCLAASYRSTGSIHGPNLFPALIGVNIFVD